MAARLLVDREELGYQWIVARRQMTRRFGLTTYYHCSKRLRDLCPARAIETANNGFRASTRFPTHNHPAPPHLQLSLRFLRELRNSVRHTFLRPITVYNNVIQNYPQLVRQHPFHRVEARMLRWHAQVSPPAVTTYLDVQRVCEADRWQSLLSNEAGGIRLNCVTSEDNITALIYGNQDVPQNVPDLAVLYATTNAVIRPQINGTQTVLSLTFVHQGVIFTFGWALFGETSRAIYRDAMSYVKTVLLPNHNITTVVTNLDGALRNGVQDVWPEANVTSDYTNYCMTLLHHAHHDININLNNNEHMIILRKLMALGLLQAAAIPAAFHQLNDAIVGDLREAFGPMLRWFAETFINNIDTASFSFFEKVELLTDVSMKVPAKMLASLNDIRDPGMWALYKASLQVLRSAAHDLRRLNQGHRRGVITMSPRVTSCIPRTEITNLWNLHRDGASHDRLLMVGARILRDYVGILVFRQEYVRGQFLPAFPQVEQQAAYVLPQPNPNHVILELDFDEVRHFVDLPIPGEEVQVPEELLAAGDEGDHGDGREEDEPMYNWRCVGCEEQPINFICRPCNCIILCGECRDALRHESQMSNAPLRCPSCHLRINAFERVYFNATGDAVSPYDWRCQICSTNTVDYMGLACHEVKYCTACVQVWREVNEGGGNVERCAGCNAVGPMVHVRIRRAQ